MYLNNTNFRFNFIGGINIITNAIFMKNGIRLLSPTCEN